MNFLKKEKQILNLIKYGPILFVSTLSLIITLLFIENQTITFINDTTKLKNDYIVKNKQRIKNEIFRYLNEIKQEKNNAEIELMKQIKSRVYEAHNIATSIFINESKPYKDGLTHEKKHILNTIKHALGSIRFNEGRGYFFIDDINGVKILHPIKELENKNLLEFKDTKGYQFVKTIVKTIKNKTETFDSYYWYKGEDTSKSYKKIGFYKYFEPLNMAIGTGEYIDEFEKDLKTKLLARIKNVKIGKNGYIFVLDTNGLFLSHFKKEYIGVNRIDVKDSNGNYLIRDIVDFAKKNKNGFISYLATAKPTSVIKNTEKISYLTLFDDWNWIIGTGFYLDELNQAIADKKEFLVHSNQKAIKNIVFISLSITILFIILSFYISKLIAIKFEEYRFAIKKEIQKTVEKEKVLIQQSKMAAMGEMIENIAHQWRQPLSVISTASSGLKLKNEMKVLQEKDINATMKSINSSVQHLSQTINVFRDFFQTNKEKKEFDLNNTVEKTFKLITSQFKNANITVIKNIEEVTLNGFEQELIQVLINILNNARDELIKKEQKIKIILIKTLMHNNILEIFIQDNAGGIPKENLNEVFESHFTTKQNLNGTGIGLYMSKMIIEEHMKGTITAGNINFTHENISYSGAQFKICLPLTKDKEDI